MSDSNIALILIIVVAISSVVFLIKLIKSDSRNPSNTQSVVQPEKPSRRYVKDVKPGEEIQIEWSRIKGGIGYIKCLNNDPETKKIFLVMIWNNNPEKTKLVLNYSDKELANFHLLNPVIEPQQTQSGGTVTPEAIKPKSILKTVNCNYRGYLIVYDVDGKKVQELSGEMTYGKYKEIESRAQVDITEFEGADDYKRITSELKTLQ